MAVEGGVVGRTMDGSDDTFELTCTSCIRKNRNREATKYCVECQDYYCSTCVEVHDDISALSDHTLLGRSEFPTNGSQNLISMPTERCGQHRAKLMDMYCKNDDQIGCPVCMAVKHRPCVDVVYIPDEIESIMTDEDLQKMKEDMKKAKTRVEDLIQARHNNLAGVEQDRITALGKIKELRDTINNTLDELEKTTIKECEAKSKGTDNQIKADLEVMSDIVKDIDSIQQQLESAVRNQSQQFVCMKNGQKKMCKAEQLTSEVAQSSGNTRIQFEPDPDIEQFLNGLASLGKVQEKADDNLKQVQQHARLYQVKQTYNVRVSDDGKTCDIFGSCILKSGTLLLADNDNKKLKQLDSSTYKVVGQCDLSAGPIAVCEINIQEVAVTLNNKTIQFVSLGSKMAPTRSIQTTHTCWGLAFSNGEMFISDYDKQVYVYDTSGTLLRTICKDQSGKDIFSSNRRVSVSEDGSKLYVADYRTGLVSLDRQGRVLSQFSDQELSGAYGVCDDGCGTIFVCGTMSHNVVQIGPSGDKLGVLVKLSDGISSLRSVCYDRSNSRLIVTNCSDNITVFDLIRTVTPILAL